MRIITWNCQGAFRKKWDKILAFKPDILIMQECEHTDKFLHLFDQQKPTEQFWYGDNKHKGISIFSFTNFKITLLSYLNPEFRYIIPIQLTGHNHRINLLAVWAMDNKENYDARYIGQVWLAINFYKNLLTKPILIIVEIRGIEPLTF